MIVEQRKKTKVKKKKKKKVVKLSTLRNKADKLFYKLIVALNNGKCEVCNKKAVTAHHFVPKSLSSLLRYDVRNGIAICLKEHFSHHKKADPEIHWKVFKKRGAKWGDELIKIRHQKNQKYLGKEYYRSVIKRLEESLDK